MSYETILVRQTSLLRESSRRPYGTCVGFHSLSFWNSYQGTHPRLRLFPTTNQDRNRRSGRHGKSMNDTLKADTYNSPSLSRSGTFLYNRSCTINPFVASPTYRSSLWKSAHPMLSIPYLHPRSHVNGTTRRMEDVSCRFVRIQPKFRDSSGFLLGSCGKRIKEKSNWDVSNWIGLANHDGGLDSKTNGLLDVQALQSSSLGSFG